MEEARRQYLSTDLVEIASIAQTNPWGTETKEEIEKCILGKLSQDLINYDSKSRETWEKLFGKIAVHLADVSKYMVIGGTTGGLLGNLIPNTSTWEMLILGAMAGAATEAGKIVETLTEMLLEARKTRRSSIAYITQFK
jgi:hypothetical protein